MNLRRLPVFAALSASPFFAFPHAAVSEVAGESETGLSEYEERAVAYRLPPDPIPRILDAPPLPSVSFSPDGTLAAVLEREALPPIERLAEPELRLAGIRINPNTNGPSRAFYYTRIAFLDFENDERREAPLPKDALISHVRWSPNGAMLAFANTVEDGIELWIADSRTREVRRLLGPGLNAAVGTPFSWSPDSRFIIARHIVSDRGSPPESPPVPTGPIVRESDGRPAPARTYQDLLGSPLDEALFEHYFTSQLVRVPLDPVDSVESIGRPGIFYTPEISPDGRYLLKFRIQRPYTYAAPLFAFPRKTYVFDLESHEAVYMAHDRTEVTLPPLGRDMVVAEPRRFEWRADEPATLIWVEAADGGDAGAPAETRDRLLMLDAPFDGESRTLIDLDMRLSGIDWGRDDLALVHGIWRTSSRTKTWIVDPSVPEAGPRLLRERSAEDRYGDPGDPVTVSNDAGFPVLRFASSGSAVYLSGDGASPRGDYPFLDRLDLESGGTERLWQAEDPYYESVSVLLDDDAERFITRRESREEAPNYFIRGRTESTLRPITAFPDPAPELEGLQREILTYSREDGITLSATLFTPPGYDRESDGPLPMLVWAYPREFRDADAAGQVRDSPNRFSRPVYSSPLFLLTQDYAVLAGPAMPVIGEGDEEPNDTYIEQLVMSARAAVDKVVELGVAERGRIAIGGHSYGAFMAANLLAHTDLFSAGIARSGAFNRTLTPFGFQAEPRMYWDARDVYLQMSPFHYADKIRDPLLLIHGDADNNPGTYPMQSERMYQALKAHGAPARLVMLPHESHGYVARESVLHVLAEMIEWMEKHVRTREETL